MKPINDNNELPELFKLLAALIHSQRAMSELLQDQAGLMQDIIDEIGRGGADDLRG